MPVRLTDFIDLLTPGLRMIAGRIGYHGRCEMFVDHLTDDLKLNGQTLFTRNEIDDNIYIREFQDRVTAILMPGWSVTDNVTDIASLIWDRRDRAEA